MSMSNMPNWQQFLIPTLRVMSDGIVRHRREFEPLVADSVSLSPEQRAKRLPSSGKLTYINRIGWAVSFLTNVGALDRPSRGHYVITDAGRTVLRTFPNGATERELRELGDDPASILRPYRSTGPRASRPDNAAAREAEEMTPIEQVQEGIARITDDVAAELLRRLQGKDPAFFEQAVMDLLLAMGYGGAGGAGYVTQLTNDGGIDGVIDQDVLGINRVYIQAKRYASSNVVQRPDVQGFVGALSGKADSGVFITTSQFSDGAKQYARNIPTRIILIDGARLSELMIRFGVGVQVKDTYHVVEIDEDFFA